MIKKEGKNTNCQTKYEKKEKPKKITEKKKKNKEWKMQEKRMKIKIKYGK